VGVKGSLETGNGLVELETNRNVVGLLEKTAKYYKIQSCTMLKAVLEFLVCSLIIVSFSLE
jgi:hypothetical protein